MDIRTAIRVINEMKNDGVVDDYAIGGAVGATFYLEPFATLDVDVFISFQTAPDSLIISPDPVFTYLKNKGFEMEGEYFIIGDWPVQLLPPHSPLVEHALSNAITHSLEDEQVRVMSAEHLAAIALQLGRPKDKARLLQFVEEDALDKERFDGLLREFELSKSWATFCTQFDLTL